MCAMLAAYVSRPKMPEWLLPRSGQGGGALTGSPIEAQHPNLRLCLEKL